MLVILDSNEYIFALGAIRKATCERLFEEVSQRAEDITVRITRLIVDEVRNNLTPEAFIAAYTEYVGADFLVSENRHFLTHHSNLPFKVLTAEKCLNLIKHPLR